MDRTERFSDLYQAQYEAVLRYALRRTDPETARDVAAETFLVAWRRLDVVPAESGMAGPWLYGGLARTWTAPGDVPALPFSLDWISQSQLAFTWQDQLKGSATYFFTGRSQIRVLDTAAPGHDLLASRVLLSGGGKLGFIQSASVGPDGSPINVATFRVSSIGGRGSAKMLLAQVSPSGAVNKTFAAYTRSYSGLQQEGTVTTPCQVLATDTTGRHTLASCPAFGRIDNGAFTPLARTSDDFGAAW